MALKLAKKTNKIQKVVKKTKTAAETRGKDRVFTRPTGQYVENTGRRKTATARVRLYPAGNNTDSLVNDSLLGEYFSNVSFAQKRYLLPFELTGTTGKFAVSATISGSGIEAQLDALVHGIARALIEHNGDYRPLLKAAGLLTRDDRMKETRKIGTGGKARRKRQSPKR